MVKKVLIVGMGSMGRRRARLLKKMDASIVICGVDSNEERVAQSLEKDFDVAYTDLKKGIAKFQPEVGIVSTSPSSHHSIIPVLLERGIHVFTELNLISDGYEEMMAMATEKKVTLFLSSTLLYRKDLEYIIKQTSGKKVNYNYHSGQYLPDWHPWESYKNFFVHDVRTNGCREIFAIDLPWLLAAMGPVKDVTVLCDNLSDLEVDYPDNYMVQVLHEGGSKGTILVDIVSRKAVRSLEVYSDELYLRWEGSPNALYCYQPEQKTMEKIETYGAIDKDSRYSDTIIENAYEEELRTFFAVIEGKEEPRYTFADDLKTLELIDHIEANAKRFSMETEGQP